MTTRIATAQDLNDIVALRLVNSHYHASLLPGVNVYDTAREYFIEHTEKCIHDEKSTIVLGEVNGKLMAYGFGLIDAVHPVLNFGKTATIDDIFVDPKFERRGYGELLVQELTTWFTDQNIDRVDLNVYSSNPKGSAFWDKLGFELMFRRMYRKV